jgi:hypothetical protein
VSNHELLQIVEDVVARMDLSQLLHLLPLVAAAGSRTDATVPDRDAGRGQRRRDVVEDVDGVVAHLGPILRNRLGQNLRTKYKKCLLQVCVDILIIK